MDKVEAQQAIKNIIFEHIDPQAYKVFLFGSRAKGQAKRWSDFDIGIMGQQPLTATLQAELEEALEVSSIPYLVEIVDFHKVDENFKKLALEDAILWN
jgi:predicted nucleotidyltransferase